MKQNWNDYANQCETIKQNWNDYANQCETIKQNWNDMQTSVKQSNKTEMTCKPISVYTYIFK